MKPRVPAGSPLQMRPEDSSSLQSWLSAFDLACAAAAGALWYLFPGAGPWPLLVALVPWGVRLTLDRRLTTRTAYDVPLLLFLLSAGVAVWSAYDRQAAWSKFWLIVGGILLFYAFSNAEALAGRRAWLLAVFGDAVALYFLATHDWDVSPAKIEALTRLGKALQAPLPALSVHRLHPNVAGGIMAMMLPFTALVTLRAARLFRSAHTRASIAAFALGLASLAFTAFGLLMSTSRGAWVALLVATMLAGVWVVSSWMSRRKPAAQGWMLPGLLTIVLVTAIVVAVVWPGGPVAALSALPGPKTGTSRIELLHNTFTLVKDYPVVGAGLGSFPMLYSTYALLLHAVVTVHSHNLFLNVAVEQGLPALLLLVSMWLLFAVVLWREAGRSARETAADSVRSASPRTLHAPYRGELVAAAMSLTVVLFHGLVDDVLYGSRAVLLLFLPLAFAARPPRLPRRRAAGQGPSRLGLVLPGAIAVLLLLAVIWRQPLLSTVYSNLGAVHQSQAELSVYHWPDYLYQDAVRRSVDLSRPISEFERALTLNRANPTANRRLGMIELSLGDYPAALLHLEAAYAAEPGSSATRLLLGEAYVVNGRLAEGQALWASVADTGQQRAVRISWYGYIGDVERRNWMQQALSGR